MHSIDGVSKVFLVKHELGSMHFEGYKDRFEMLESLFGGLGILERRYFFKYMAADYDIHTMRPATADVWYDFGFQTVAVYSNSGRFLKVIDVPDQSEKYRARMVYLWMIHVTGRAKLFSMPRKVGG